MVLRSDHVDEEFLLIFLSHDSRLGNQLFQYSVINKRFPGHRLFLFGFEDSERIMTGFRAIFISREKIPSWLTPHRIRKVLNFLAALLIIGQITETSDDDKYQILIKKGFLWRVFTVESCYFQHESETIDLAPDFKVNSQLIEDAQNWIYANSPKTNFSDLVFVHVRRGDYLSWPSAENPAALSDSWYKNAIETLSKRLVNPFFLLITDDFSFATKFFGSIENLVISNNNADFDFALMTLCNSGILSASTFSWWGAWISRNQHLNTGTFVAPKYWIGHSNKQWIPSGFKSDWLTYLD